MADARLSAELLRDEVESFREMGAQNLLLPAFYAHAFARSDSSHAAMAPLFGTESIEAGLSDTEALDLLFSVAEGRVCPHGASGVSDLQPEPLFWPSAAYALAWLTVAGTSTELYRFPLVILPRTYTLAAVTVIVAATLSGLVVRRKLDRLDLIGVLKARG